LVDGKEALSRRQGSRTSGGDRKMIRVFPRKTAWTPTDDLAFVGDPPLFRPEGQEVCVSVTFTKDISEGKRLQEAWSNYYEDVKLGGCAFDDPGGEFVPGRFIKEGVTITSRGCNKKCPWCFVPKREGKLREINIANGWIVQDNNLLACSEDHIRRVFSMLRCQNHPIIFSGGLDATLFNEWHRELIDGIRLKELWFACDCHSAIKNLERISKLLNGISTSKKRCYVLIGFQNETIKEAEHRLKSVYDLGFDPFSQLFMSDENIEYNQEWRALNRKWSRPAIYHSERRIS
jgi:hypothetical protein